VSPHRVLGRTIASYRLDPVIPAALAVVAVALLALLTFADTDPAVAAVGVVLLVIATGLALVGWRAVRSRERRLRAVVDALRKEQSDERERLERHVRRLEGALSHERVLMRRLRDSWQAEREWSRELRTQLQVLHGRSSGRGDVLEPVLDAPHPAGERSEGNAAGPAGRDGPRARSGRGR
jgi:uncharacterized protein HemX